MAPLPPDQPEFHLDAKLSLSRSRSSGVASSWRAETWWASQTGSATSPKEVDPREEGPAGRDVVHHEVHLIEADRCHEATVPPSARLVASSPRAQPRTVNPAPPPAPLMRCGKTPVVNGLDAGPELLSMDCSSVLSWALECSWCAVSACPRSKKGAESSSRTQSAPRRGHRVAYDLSFLSGTVYNVGSLLQGSKRLNVN